MKDQMKRARQAVEMFIENQGQDIIGWIDGLIVAVDDDNDTLAFIKVRLNDPANAMISPDDDGDGEREAFEMAAIKFLADRDDLRSLYVRFDVATVTMLGEGRGFLRYHTNIFGGSCG